MVEKLKDKPFVLISVSADDKKETLKEFLQTEKMPWTHWWEGQRESGILKDWNVRFFPTIYVIDAKGVLRYEDKLSREAVDSKLIELLGQHLALARDGELPIRMIVTSVLAAGSGKSGRTFHVRPDLVGKVVKFDGDHFIIDFTRLQEPREATARRK